MKPAWSVVAFTVLSGAGLGALVWLAFIDLAAIGGSAHALPANWRARTGVVALVLLVAGLGASTLHLGNPRNAWRSLSRLATSWLSREAAAALVLLPLAAVWIAGLEFGMSAFVRALLAVGVIVLAWITLHCTAMIYASLKPVRHWHTSRVPIGYFALGHASGGVVVIATLRAYGVDVPTLAAIAIALLLAAAVIKLEYYVYIAADAGKLTLEQAIGVPQGVGPAAGTATIMRARLFEAGHSRGTFLTQEFGYTLHPAQRTALRLLFWIAGVVVPLLWLASGLDEWPGGAIASAACLLGLCAERWLFFAEARHTVRLYHGDPST